MRWHIKPWTWRRKIGWFFGFILGAPIVYILAVMFGTWPLFLVASVSKETEIKFPPSARLVRGYSYHFVSIMVAAQITMPEKDLPGFLNQPLINTVRWPLNSYGPPQLKQGLSSFGFRTDNIRSAECRDVSNGYGTWLVIDTDNPRIATVYVYMDEP